MSKVTTLVSLTLLLVTGGCAHKGVPSASSIPKAVYIDQAEYDAGFPNVIASISTRAPLRGNTRFILTIPPTDSPEDEYALCYITTYATHSPMIAQITGGGAIQAIEDGLQRAVERLMNGVSKGDIGLPTGIAAATGFIGGANSAWQEEERLFDSDVRGCVMRRVPGAYVFQATGQDPN